MLKVKFKNSCVDYSIYTIYALLLTLFVLGFLGLLRTRGADWYLF